jgi:hypothetical protein
MGIAGRLAHCLVTSGLHDLAGRRPSHRKPRTECVTEPMPRNARNPRLSDAGLEPRAIVEAFLLSFSRLFSIFPREHPVGSLLTGTTDGLDCPERIRVQMDCPYRSILSFI